MCPCFEFAHCHYNWAKLIQRANKLSYSYSFIFESNNNNKTIIWVIL